MKTNFIYFLFVILCVGLSACKKSSTQSTDSIAQANDTIVSDSVDNQDIQIQDEHKYISSTMANRLKPILKEWLNYGNMNIEQFLEYDSGKFEPVYAEKLELEPEDLVYKPLLRDYSPDKRYYLDLLENILSYDSETNMYETMFDDSQSIWLYDLKDGTVLRAQLYNMNELCDAAYWIDNNTFVLVGSNIYSSSFIQVFNLKDMTRNFYVMKKSAPEKGFLYQNIKNRDIQLKSDSIG